MFFFPLLLELIYHVFICIVVKMITNRKAIIKLLFSWCVFDYLDIFEDYLTLLFVNANSCAKFSRHTIRITAFYWQNSQYPLYSWMLLNPYRNITCLALCQKHDVISVSISSKISYQYLLTIVKNHSHWLKRYLQQCCLYIRWFRYQRYRIDIDLRISITVAGTFYM